MKRRPLPSEEERQRALEIQERVKAGKPVLMGERSFARRVLGSMEDVPEETPTWVQAMRVGDLGLVGAPGELFVELGLDIKRRSPFAQTIVIELANDSIGYIPTRRAFEEGAYEPESCRFASGLGEQIADVAVRLLNRLHAVVWLAFKADRTACDILRRLMRFEKIIRSRTVLSLSGINHSPERLHPRRRSSLIDEA